MAVVRSNPTHSTNSTNVADLLERVLDKGVVIAGDIKVSLLDIELLTIQIRLVVCSIDKAKEMGMDWWANSPVFGNPRSEANESASAGVLERLEQRLQQIERAIPQGQPPAPALPAVAQDERRFRPITAASPTT